MSPLKTPRTFSPFIFQLVAVLLLTAPPQAVADCMPSDGMGCTPQQMENYRHTGSIDGIPKPAKVHAPGVGGANPGAVKPPPGATPAHLTYGDIPVHESTDNDPFKWQEVGLTPAEGSVVDHQFPGAIEKMHDKWHILTAGLDQMVANENLSVDDAHSRGVVIEDGIHSIARTAVSYSHWKAKSSDADPKPGWIKKIGDDFNATIDKLEATPVHYMHEGQWETHDSAHLALMEGGLEPIMNEIVADVKKVGGGSGGGPQSGHQEDTAKANPGSVNAQLGAAEDLLQKNDAQGAMTYLGNALKLDPQNPKALSDLAVADYQLHDNAGAAQSAHAALDLKPNDPAAQAVLQFTEGHAGVGDAGGRLNATDLFAQRQNAGSADGAVAGGFSAVGALAGAAGSGESAALTRDAVAALRVGDAARAIPALDKALELNPNNIQALNLRAMALARMHRYEDALRDVEAGLQKAPKNQALMDTRALVLNKLKRFAEAEAQARAAIAQNPNDASAWRNLSEALAGLGDRAGALAALRKAAELDARFKPMLDTALQLPADSDLNLLFADDNAAGGPGTHDSPAARKRKLFGLVVGGALFLGLLLVLLLWPMISKGLRTAWATITRPRVVGGGAREPSGGLIKGQYRPGRQIGFGGMGTVYEGLDVSLNRKVAIKKMRDEIRSDPRERARFLQEAKTVAALHHPNIVDIYAIAEEGRDVYLVFEHVDGKTLHEHVAARGRLTFAQTLPILRGAAAGLEFAHGRGIIHRDLKPSNIMQDAEGRIKVMDFGIARVAKDALTKVSQVMTNTIVGTPPYMAPEQEQGLVRKESDVYALALCVYEMLTGRLAFAGTGAGMLMSKINKAYAPVTTLAPELPAEIDAVFAAALDPDPAKRIASARELVACFETVSAGRRG